MKSDITQALGLRLVHHRPHRHLPVLLHRLGLPTCSSLGLREAATALAAERSSREAVLFRQTGMTLPSARTLRQAAAVFIEMRIRQSISTNIRMSKLTWKPLETVRLMDRKEGCGFLFGCTHQLMRISMALVNLAKSTSWKTSTAFARTSRVAATIVTRLRGEKVRTV